MEAQTTTTHFNTYVLEFYLGINCESQLKEGESG
jgi:hypothetical protein